MLSLESAKKRSLYLVRPVTKKEYFIEEAFIES
ncbi:MAG: hypothetical protein US13_C0004G0078 [candidate division TM6 bacterium GW2011_GWE2_36_25]|nr:MAG: hypothetical protein US03_C0004G0078 [candidate division TM6 bacterium GW2011_GWF2_36_131]KKQ03256.1 MAG: hypothetical protein US13_C0004G0078 [candidate division TM6 bacterium GW2011_GWE2_36_25]KKQ19847.1 MAG: hypothetical protein US32_C0004G0031 [candidate division TM6 bacterium GW2011_GWA2_36_9]